MRTKPSAQERAQRAYAALLRASEAIDRLTVHPRDDEGRLKPARRKRKQSAAGRPQKTERERRLDAARAKQLKAGIEWRAALRELQGEPRKGQRTRLLGEAAAALHKSTKTVQDMMKPHRRSARRRKRGAGASLV